MAIRLLRRATFVKASLAMLYAAGAQTAATEVPYSASL